MTATTRRPNSAALSRPLPGMRLIGSSGREPERDERHVESGDELSPPPPCGKHAGGDAGERDDAGIDVEVDRVVADAREEERRKERVLPVEEEADVPGERRRRLAADDLVPFLD